MKRILALALAASLIWPHQALAAAGAQNSGPKGPNFVQRIVLRVGSWVPGFGGLKTKHPTVPNLTVPTVPTTPNLAIKDQAADAAHVQAASKAVPAVPAAPEALPANADAAKGLAETAATPGAFQQPAQKIKRVIDGKTAFTAQGAEEVPAGDGSPAAEGASGPAQLSKSAGPAAPTAKPQPPAPAPASARERGAWNWIKRHLPFQEYTRSEKAYTIAQITYLVAIALQIAAMALFVGDLTGDVSNLGYAVGVQRWALAVAAFFGARWVSRTGFARALRLTGWARAGIFMSIATLGFMGVLPFWLYLGLVGLNGAVIAANTLADMDENGANAMIGGKDEAEAERKKDKAVFLFDNIGHLLACILPLPLGAAMAALNHVLPGLGPQVAIALMAVAFGVASMLYEIVKPVTNAAASDGTFNKRRVLYGIALSFGLPVALGLAMKFIDNVLGAPGLGAQLVVGLGAAAALAYGLVTRPRAIGAAIAGVARAGLTILKRIASLLIVRPVRWILRRPAAVKKAEGPENVVDSVIRIFQTVYKNKVVRGVVLIRAWERFLEEAIFGVILPLYAAVLVLRTGIGEETAQTAFAAAIEAGGWIATGALLLFKNAFEKKLGPNGFLVLVTAAAALTFLPSLFLWSFAPSLAAGLGVALTLKLLYQPLRSVITRLTQGVMKNNPEIAPVANEAMAGMRFVTMAFAGAGAAVFAKIAQAHPQGSLVPFQYLTYGLVGLSLVYFLALWWIYSGQKEEKARAAAAAAQPKPQN